MLVAKKVTLDGVLFNRSAGVVKMLFESAFVSTAYGSVLAPLQKGCCQ